MGFICGLAVVLVIFEGIIIQCDDTVGGEGAGRPEGSTSSNQGESVPTIDSIEDPTSLPDHLIKEIFGRIDNKGRVQILREHFKEHRPDLLMSIILRNCIILIKTETFDKINSAIKDEGFDATHENKQNDLELIFGSYQGLEKFLENCGKHVRVVDICLNKSKNESRILYVIEKYAKNVKDLRILDHTNDEQFWKALSNGKNGTIFSKVKKLKIGTTIKRNEFDLHSIFPRLESFQLYGMITRAGTNCLANVEKLEELTLQTGSIEEYQLHQIFAQNQNMKKLSLTFPETRETMQSIAEHLKDLKTLKVMWPGEKFLLQANDDHRPICVLPNLENFYIAFYKMHKVYKTQNLSFDMPVLRKLTLDANITDTRFIEFIEHFEKLETVELTAWNNKLVEPMKKTWKLEENSFLGETGENTLRLNKSRK